MSYFSTGPVSVLEHLIVLLVVDTPLALIVAALVLVSKQSSAAFIAPQQAQKHWSYVQVVPRDSRIVDERWLASFYCSGPSAPQPLSWMIIDEDEQCPSNLGKGMDGAGA